MAAVVNIKHVSNGYIVTDSIGAEHVYAELDDAFEYMLGLFEGRYDTGYEDAYGKVIVERKRKD